MITLDLGHLLQSTAPEDAPLRRQLSSISTSVAKSKKIVVVSGAGISCSCGIPDFRSQDGLYNLVKTRYPNIVLTGKDLFSSSLFRSAESTSLFYSFIAELKLSIDAVEPSKTHLFVKKLDEKGKLMRSYTQNIDGLERRAGLACSSSPPPDPSSSITSIASTTPFTAPSSEESPLDQPQSSQESFPPSSQSSDYPSSSQDSILSAASTSTARSSGGPTMHKKWTKNVQLHGDIHQVRCMVCQSSYDFTPEYVEIFREGDAPECPACEERAGERRARAARTLATGVLRPSIVLYDENHPNGDSIGSLQTHDLSKTPDLLLVLGTSLKVHGLKRLVKELSRSIHSLPVTKARPHGGKGRVVFVNKTEPQGAEWKGVFDYWVKGDCDAFVSKVEEEWRTVKKSDWERQETLTGLGAKIVKNVDKKEGVKGEKPVEDIGPSANGVTPENIELDLPKPKTKKAAVKKTASKAKVTPVDASLTPPVTLPPSPISEPFQTFDEPVLSMSPSLSCPSAPTLPSTTRSPIRTPSSHHHRHLSSPSRRLSRETTPQPDPSSSLSPVSSPTSSSKRSLSSSKFHASTEDPPSPSKRSKRSIRQTVSATFSSPSSSPCSAHSPPRDLSEMDRPTETTTISLSGIEKFAFNLDDEDEFEGERQVEIELTEVPQEKVLEEKELSVAVAPTKRATRSRSRTPSVKTSVTELLAPALLPPNDGVSGDGQVKPVMSVPVPLRRSTRSALRAASSEILS
ncbi:Sirtuin 5 and related class III sirtuins (SIR2 family) [Phaffia rhodozyma]|uniref:Sirtuin 5 and related class III sirtuins (SIR2 family) n=1 Tax=Phaffia rhodozyma TaxID=264483 RepID=A0A0F7SVK2_PHARH|nr:Sirtuin 5 and related class III sirtuins (SIR2 family) [Phaffia rhodozyma]